MTVDDDANVIANAFAKKGHTALEAAIWRAAGRLRRYDKAAR